MSPDTCEPGQCNLRAMRSGAANIAALSFAIAAAVSVAGCSRSPFASSDAGASDGPVGAPSIGDAGRQPVDAPAEAAGNSPAAPHDANDANDANGSDANVPDDANEVDALADVANPDAPADIAPGDAPESDTPPDVASDGEPSVDGAAADRAIPDGGSDVRPEDQPCGPLGFICAPFACDVARGVCKNACLTNADCVTGKACNPVGLCGFKEDRTCASSDECLSGHCAQGVCCDTACNQPCASCALPGTLGTCTLVPPGLLDPIGTCPAGSTCNGRGGCVPPTCAIDSDCGSLYLCKDARCVPCNATCASSADCTVGSVCVHRNDCTYCDRADAGALP